MIRIEIPERLRSTIRVVSSDDARDEHEWLTREERDEAGRIHLHRRRAEWMLGRVAAKQLAVDLGLCDSPLDCSVPSRGVKPVMFIRGERSDLDLSISHSGSLAAAAIDRKPVGIDIQMRRRIDPRATRFFLRDDESELATELDDESLLDLWSAKEAALKASGVSRYRQVVLEKMPAPVRSFHFAAGSVSGEVETDRLVDGTVILALARGGM